jgi:hypothetical protein
MSYIGLQAGSPNGFTAIGYPAGYSGSSNQGTNPITLGHNAGYYSQGGHSASIGSIRSIGSIGYVGGGHTGNPYSVYPNTGMYTTIQGYGSDSIHGNSNTIIGSMNIIHEGSYNNLASTNINLIGDDNTIISHNKTIIADNKIIIGNLSIDKAFVTKSWIKRKYGLSRKLPDDLVSVVAEYCDDLDITLDLSEVVDELVSSSISKLTTQRS